MAAVYRGRFGQLWRDRLHAAGLTFMGSAREEIRRMKSDDEWRKELSEAQFCVLRECGTERAGSSPLDKFYEPGTYMCAGCGKALFSSDTKYDSGSGWPSFFQPLPGAIGTSTDYKLVYPRTEVHCTGCNGHLGHVFDDGPAPTGKRYCMNGVALNFVAKDVK